MFRSFRVVHIVWIPGLTILLSVVFAQERPDPSQQSTADLIQQLGSTRFRERDAAHSKLLTRDDAYPDIHRARPALNAEGRRRADAILDVMGQRRMKQFLDYGREGRVDLLVEWSSVAGDKIDSEEFWQCVFDV